MIVMREIMNAKQTQVHPCTPARGACGGLVQSLSRHLAESSPAEVTLGSTAAAALSPTRSSVFGMFPNRHLIFADRLDSGFGALFSVTSINARRLWKPFGLLFPRLSEL